ncbi:MBL fold metallo-hydrolase [Polycladospora coralii]|nr:MBL fold metallo-hydrolase [Polycladospora coralii]
MLFLWVVGGVFLVIGGIVLSYRYGKASRITMKKPAQYLQPQLWSDEEVTVGWIGHSTMYINLFGTKIITDPVLGKRVGEVLFPGLQVGFKRIVAPAIHLSELDKVDLILISHGHFDHLDIPSLKKLAHADTHVVTAPRISHLLNRLWFNSVAELDSEESIQLENGVKITAVPVKHWGNRYPWNRDYGYTGFLIEKNGVRLFFPGDTAYTPDFLKLRRYGEIDIAFMPIGAYYPDSFQSAHCTPEQAWKMFLDTGAKWFIPMHWDTFLLSQEPIAEPLQRLLHAAGSERERIALTEQGKTFQLVQEKVRVYT